MTTAVELPTAPALRELFEMLTGCDVAARPELVPLLAPGDIAAAGVYLGEEGQVVAAVLLDLGLAAAVGASLSMMPKGRVEESLRSGVVHTELVPNLGEVLNVAASLFNGDGRPHVVYRRLFLAPDVPVGLAKAANRQTGRLDCHVEVDGYGTGVVALVSA